MKLRSLKKPLYTLRSKESRTALRKLLGLTTTSQADTQRFAAFLSATKLSHHSANIEQGTNFIALRGQTTSGVPFIPAMIENLCTAIVAKRDFNALKQQLAPQWLKKLIVVATPEKIAGDLAAHFYAHPSKGLNITAITGTNGKTSLTWILEQLTLACGHRTGVIGTIDIHYSLPSSPATKALRGRSKKTYPIAHTSANTTPHPIDLHHALAVMREAGVKHVFLEASSHGLKQRKLATLHIKSALITNFSQDHLDYHPSLADYLKSKLLLVKLLQASQQHHKRLSLSLRTLSDCNLAQLLKPYLTSPLKLGLVAPQQTTLTALKKTVKTLQALQKLPLASIAAKSPNSPHKKSTPPTPIPTPLSSHHPYLYTFKLDPVFATAAATSRPSSQSISAAISFCSRFTLRKAPLAKVVQASSYLKTVKSPKTTRKPHAHPPLSQVNLPTTPYYHTTTSLIGTMNGENLALALLELSQLMHCTSHKASKALWENLTTTLENLAIPGRMELIPCNVPATLAKSPRPAPQKTVPTMTGRTGMPTVIIDYAHTPEALKQALCALQPYASPVVAWASATTKIAPPPPPVIAQSHKHPLQPRHNATGKLYVLFGCGGDRDRSKRAQMGKVACMLSHGIILTSDNTRKEDPRQILRAIEAGILCTLPPACPPRAPFYEKKSAMPAAFQALKSPPTPAQRMQVPPYIIIPQRRQAIEAAIFHLDQDDILLIAGKGHERYEIVGTEYRPFNEVSLVKKAYHKKYVKNS